MNLKKLSSNELRLGASKAAHVTKTSDSNLLLYIQEVENRMIYCDWGFRSLFDWVEDELKLCDGSAHLRITAARLLNDFPQLVEKIDHGLLSISTINLAETFCRENKISDSQSKARIFTMLENLSKKKAIKKLFEISGKRKKVFEGSERVSADSFKVTMELSEETIEAMKEVRGMLHKEVGLDELLSLAFAALKKEINKKRFKSESQERKSKGSNVKARTFSSRATRIAFQKAKGSCENCGSTHKLQKDHRKPFSMGGLSTAENIRILCRNCNLRAAIKMGLLHPGEVKKYKKSD